MVVAGRGDSGERRVVGQVGGFHRQRPWVASENRVKSLHAVSHQFTKSHPFVALTSVGDPHNAPSAGSVIVASSLRRCWRGWRLDLDGVSRGRSRRVDGWIWTWSASAMRKSSELTLRLQSAVFTRFIGEKWRDVTGSKMGGHNNATPPFHDTPSEKKVSLCHVRKFLSHCSRHIPPRSGLPLHGQCSPRCCVARSLTRFVAKRLHFVGFERDSWCIGFAILSSLSPFQQMCLLSRQTALDTSSSHPCTELHDLVTLHGSSTMFKRRLNMYRRIKSTSLF